MQATSVTKRPHCWSVLLLLALCSLGFAGALCGAEMSTLQVLPNDAPGWITELVNPHGYRITNDAGHIIELWFRPDLPQEEPSGEFNVEFNTIPSGTVLGLLRIENQWSDYRKQILKPGLYSVRFGVQPSDGDHTGQTYFRDFLMLLPIATDTWQQEPIQDLEPLVAVSAAGAGTEHPGVMALYRIYEEVSEPGLLENDFGEPCFGLPLGDDTLGLVIEGHGQELTV